jgi:hypothetical protein
MKEYRCYTDEQIEKLGDEKFNHLVQKEAAGLMIYSGGNYISIYVGKPNGEMEQVYGSGNETPSKPYNKDDYNWNEPTSEQCLLCYEWRRYPPHQRHFGYSWWLKCSKNSTGCDCEHHKHETWYC